MDGGSIGFYRGEGVGSEGRGPCLGKVWPGVPVE